MQGTSWTDFVIIAILIFVLIVLIIGARVLMNVHRDFKVCILFGMLVTI